MEGDAVQSRLRPVVASFSDGDLTPSSPAKLRDERRSSALFDIAKVRRICLGLEVGFREAWADFPYGCCIDTSEAVVVVLNRAYLGVYRRINLRTRRGTYCGRGHQWVEVVGDGTIIDPTLGQFVGGPALHIIPPDHELYPNFKAHSG